MSVALGTHLRSL